MWLSTRPARQTIAVDSRRRVRDVPSPSRKRRRGRISGDRAWKAVLSRIGPRTSNNRPQPFVTLPVAVDRAPPVRRGASSRGQPMEFLILTVFWGCIWGALCAWLAGEKGRDGTTWFVLGFLFSLVALLVLGFSPSGEPPQTVARSTATFGSLDLARTPPPARASTSGAPRSNASKRCPDCAEEVKAEARICRFCRYEFPPTPEPQFEPESAADEQLLPPVVLDLGRWEMASADTGFRMGETITLCRDGTALEVRSARFTRRISIPDRDRIQAEADRLRVYDPIYAMSFAPLDSQSTCATVAPRPDRELGYTACSLGHRADGAGVTPIPPRRQPPTESVRREAARQPERGRPRPPAR